MRGSESTTGQLNINAKALADVVVPSLSIAEQRRAGEMIRLAHIAHRRAIDAANLRLALAQSIAVQAPYESSASTFSP